MKGKLITKIKSLSKRLTFAKQPGVALVITMLVMLTLVLISLSLVMQSNTESQISQNEEDSFHALADGEGVIDNANRQIRTYVVTVRPPCPGTCLSDLLSGTLNPVGQDNFLGFKNNLDINMSRLEIDDDTEETTSGLDTLPGFTGNWEVFRVGVDDNNDNQFDGNIRTVVYARIIDNYDDANSQNIVDTDLRVKVEVRTIYPVYVDDDGAEDTVMHKRGQSMRHLVARFQPTGNVAIRTDGTMDIHGSVTLCGECGSAHANETMEFTGSTACGSITGTDGFVTDGAGTILGDSGTQPEIYIPVINPYNDIFVPDDSIFNTTADTSLPTFLRCDGPTQYDPGNSKYFAIVRADGGTTHIYKAYRNWGDGSLPNTKWVWRLIGDSDADNIDTVKLDNCGRVVECPNVAGCSADEISTDNGVTWNPVSSTTAVDGPNNEWYNWNPNNNTNTSTCYGSQTETIPNTEYAATADGSGENQNDWNENDFSQVSGSIQSVQSTTSNANNRHLFHCTVTSKCTYTLPGVGNATNDATPVTDRGDGNGDWNTANVLNTNSGTVSMSGQNLYSPLYNAVIFVVGNISTIAGNLSNLNYNNAGAQAQIAIDDDVVFDLNKTWRVTIVATGNINATGTVNINPPTADTNKWGIIAGRDLEIGGNADDFDCSGTDCDVLPTGTLSTFAGAYLAHEQVRFHGNPGINGYVIAEDRAACSNAVNQSESDVAGNPSIHYDCENPSDPWPAMSVRLRDWEEAQRVD